MTREWSLLLYMACFCISILLINFGTQKKKKMLTYIGLLLPILLAGFRYKVGTDFVTYMSLQQKYGRLPLNSMFNAEVEPIFIIFSKISYLLDMPQLVFILYALFTIYFVYKAVEKLNLNIENNYNIGWVFFVYLFSYYLTSFNIMRQGLAISIVIYAFTYIVEKKIVKYILTVLLAILCHKTAIIILPVYFIYDNKRSVKKQMLICILFLLLVINFENIFTYITNISMFEKYSSYNMHINSNNKTVILNIIISSIYIINFKKLIEKNNDNKFYVTLYVIGCILTVLGYKSPYLKRIADYFLVSSIYLTPELILAQNNIKDRVLYTIIGIVSVIGPFIISVYILGHADLLPYKVIF